MGATATFGFAEERLNRRLIALLKKNHVKHSVDAEGVIHYSPEDEESVANTMISSIRNDVFPAWQVLSCPMEWAERYKSYMKRREIPFMEEWADGQPGFLLPRKYRPHAWKLDEKGS